MSKVRLEPYRYDDSLLQTRAGGIEWIRPTIDEDEGGSDWKPLC